MRNSLFESLSSDASESDASSVSPPAPESPRWVLVVEDDPQVREVMTRILQADGWRVLSAVSAEAARQVVEAQGGLPDLLLTDVRLPGAPGPELVRTLRALHPDLPVVYATGSGDFPERIEAGTDGALLIKPFTGEQLIEVAKAALG